MELTRDSSGGALRIALNGRLDAAGAEGIEAALSAALGDAEGDALIDLAGVSFVGSLGIRLLISEARRVARRGRRLVVCGAQPSVAEVLAHVALDTLVPVLPDVAAARAHLGA
jgi:anti-anti-sigma factor